MDCGPVGSSVHGISMDKNTGVGFYFLLLGISVTQGSNPRLLHLLHQQAGSLPLMPPGKIQEEVKDLRINNLWNISMILGFIPLLKCKNLP